jgi:hypothetical protein
MQWSPKAQPVALTATISSSQFHNSTTSPLMHMPIEIKELHIRVTVNAPADTAATEAAGAANAAPAAGAGGADKEALVAECVEQVLSILQEKQER